MKDKILIYLKRRNAFVSGEKMSRALGVSRTAVWKYVRQLKQDGYRIESVSRRGYCLTGEPDRLFAQNIHNSLLTKTFGKEYFYADSAVSTMDLAAQMAIKGAGEGTVVCAETQTKGRGRLGRFWVSPKGKGIYFSLILRPAIPLGTASQLTLVFAAAICRAIRTCTKAPAVIKWPNDILLKGKKVCGILTELNAETDRINFVIVGVGVNVAGTIPSFSKEAASLEQATGQKVSRVYLFQEILRQMEKYYQQFLREGFAPAAHAWRSLSATIGARVKVIEAGKITRGQAVDIDGQGALLIREKNGNIIRKFSGDITHLR